MGWSIFASGRSLLNKSQLRNVSNLSALPVGSGGNPPSDVELAWQAQDFQGTSTQQLIEALIPTLNLPESHGRQRKGVSYAEWRAGLFSSGNNKVRKLFEKPSYF